MKQLLAVQRMQLRKLGELRRGSRRDQRRLPGGLGCVFRFAGAGVPGPEVHPGGVPRVCASSFGKPEPHVIDQFHHPEHADILILSNVQKDGKPTGLADAGTYFHTDYSYLEVPARCTMLYSIQVPSKGGDTLFAEPVRRVRRLSAKR